MLLTMSALSACQLAQTFPLAATGITQATGDGTPETMTWGDFVRISVRELQCEIWGAMIPVPRYSAFSLSVKHKVEA